MDSYLVRFILDHSEELLRLVSGLCKGYKSSSSGSGKLVSPHEHTWASVRIFRVNASSSDPDLEP